MPTPIKSQCTPADLLTGAPLTNIQHPAKGLPLDTQSVHPQKLAYDTKTACHLLSVSAKTLNRLAARGLIRPLKATRHKLWMHRELVRFLEEAAK